MIDLSVYGFIRAGKWIKKDTVKSGIAYELTYLAKERVVYSFVIDNTPKYVGICEKDTTTLKDRMGRYKAQQGAGQNKRISEEIKKALDQGQEVEIYALKPTEILIFVDLQVDLVKGLENPLIERLKPEWNR